MTKQEKAWVESLLVAYVDEELDAAQTQRVEEILRNDAEAQAIVGVLRRSAAAARAALDQPLHEPVPERLLATVRENGKTATAGNVVALPVPRRFMRWREAVLPLAASIAMLVVGFGAGYLRYGVYPATGAYQPASADSEAFATTLREALDRDQAGVALAYDDAATATHGSVTVTGPLQTSIGKACREFRHDWSQRGIGATAFGLACRSDSGEWSVLTLPPRSAS